MNQIDTGKFIASCRKEKGLTQAQLVEKLNIADRAVSKWETESATISTIYTITMIIGILVCCICDIAISGTLTWSLIVLSSILFTWIASFPVILLGKKGVWVSLAAISLLILPFMYILSILIKVNEVFSIGAIMSIITLIFLWIIYFLYYRLKKRKLLATGITFLLAIPFTFLINVTLSKMIGEPAIDVWDVLSAFILLIMAVAFIIREYVRKKVM